LGTARRSGGTRFRRRARTTLAPLARVRPCLPPTTTRQAASTYRAAMAICRCSRSSLLRGGGQFALLVFAVFVLVPNLYFKSAFPVGRDCLVAVHKQAPVESGWPRFSAGHANVPNDPNVAVRTGFARAYAIHLMSPPYSPHRPAE